MVGTGYVGLISGLGFAEFGFNVTCIDKDNDRLRKLSQNIMPIYAQIKIGKKLKIYDILNLIKGTYQK